MDWLLDRFSDSPTKIAFIHDGRQVLYGEVVAAEQRYRAILTAAGVSRGQCVVVFGDYSPDIFCLMLALWKLGAIVIPLTPGSVIEESVALAVSGCHWFVDFPTDKAEPRIEAKLVDVQNPLLEEFRKTHEPGIILFSSGSTGKPKGILHSFTRILAKFEKARTPVVAIPFLMIDHFGGINTILAITSSLGVAVTVKSRSLGAICGAIEKHRVELLPTTPSFLTLLMTSGAHKQFDLSSLKRITYGTEVMPQSTLDRIKNEFPRVEMQQTYGLSEVGVLRSQSRTDGSLWMRIGGEGFQTKVVDDTLWIKSNYAMVGYLNAPSEFDSDGWFNTQDQVEVDGEYFRILGRKTDLINVGGQKVYPAEVEDVILTMENIRDVAVYSEKNPLLGQIVVAKVSLKNDEPLSELKTRIRTHCSTRLASFKVPTKVVITDEDLHTSRQKKTRKA